MKKTNFLILFSCISMVSLAQPVVSFSPLVTTGLTAPVDIVNAKDGSNRLFIVQQNGLVKIYSGGTVLPNSFLNVSNVINYGGERGLLSLAFHPQYSTNRYFFIWYNNIAGEVELAQLRTSASDPNFADPATRKVIMTISKRFDNHNGAKLNFGPDGNLYFGTGDGGSGGDPDNNAQNGQSLLGKMIRINVDDFTTPPYHQVPSDNPFVGTATNNIMDSIYALGLRNPWRWSFDRLTGDMWIADVGQGAWEEVNFRTPANMKGVNYGWRCYEGTHNYDLSQCGANPSAGKVVPIFEYAHNATGGLSITGGYVYRGNEFPSLQGWYICCDYVKSNGWLIKPDGTGGWTIVTQNNFPTGISSFGEAEDGTLYAVKLGGTLYKVITSPVTDIRDIKADNAAKLIITPNPAKNMVLIKSGNLKYIRIFDLAGKQILQKNINSTAVSFEINTEKFAAGTYIVHAVAKNGVIKVGKLNKQ